MFIANWKKDVNYKGIRKEQVLTISKSPGHMGEKIRLKDAAGSIPRACNRPKQNILLMILLNL